MIRAGSLAAALACVALSACSGETPQPGVSGVVQLAGDVPEKFRQRLEDLLPGVPRPRALVDDGGGVLDAVVTLESDAAAAALGERASAEVVVDQVDSRYRPHVAVVPAGGSVRFLNSDKILHNVHVRRGADSVASHDMDGGDAETLGPLREPGTLTVGCNFHPWMAGYVRVVATPYHAVTDAQGRFRIDGIPDGRYRVTVWHGFLAAVGDALSVEIVDGKSVPLRLAVERPR